MSNVIVLRSAYARVGKEYFISPCPDPKTGRLPQCVKTVNSVGDMILSEKEVEQMGLGLAHFIPADHVFHVTDGTSFNLDDVVDAANWEAIKHCNWIAKDRDERDSMGNLLIDGSARKYGVADLYVERPGEEVRLKMTKKQLIFRASQYVYEDTESNRIKKAKVLGRDMRNAMTADVLDFLIETCEKYPEKVIKIYEGEDWKLHLFVLEAIDRHVIRKIAGSYMYDDKHLGGSMEAVIETVKDFRYKQMVDSIKKETYPEYGTRDSIEAAKDGMTSGIPHFDEDLTPVKKGSTKK